MNPSQQAQQGQAIPVADPAGTSVGMPQPPTPPGALPVSSGAPDAALLPNTPAAGAPADAATAAWLAPTVPVGPAQGTGGATKQGTPAVPEIADDGDLIEKEWVMKAKQIVDHTRQDPHRQTKELHAFKAEYMKKRYNKVIEPVEE
jgi:hypothetical protein